MDIEDLRKFLVIASCNNLQTASGQLNQTAGALSKVIKRLEARLETLLFDRVGRNINLNHDGRKFFSYAQKMVHESEQILSEFKGAANTTRVKLSGPSVLVQYWLPTIINNLANSNATFDVNIAWEGEALQQVSNGQVHIALMTQVAVNDISSSDGLESIELGTSRFCVVAASSHPLLINHKEGGVTTDLLAQFPFACPSISPFCGIERGVGSDGWRDDVYPRNIAYRCNEFSILLSLVQQGQALAFVPDFIAKQFGLSVIEVTDCDYVCQEHMFLTYKPSLAAGWLNKLVRCYD
jgi:DNA-binding transcriptional LysR family regulator